LVDQGGLANDLADSIGFENIAIAKLNESYFSWVLIQLSELFTYFGYYVGL